jgi:hypothetical protein
MRGVPLAVTLIGLAAASGLLAQTRIDVEGGDSAPMKVTAPEPGKASQPVTVAPGPEPWYTVFGTGEVIGYIEPCG